MISLKYSLLSFTYCDWISRFRLSDPSSYIELLLLGVIMSDTLAQNQQLASQARRPLRREGAMVFLSPAEQAVEDARSRSSPLPPVSSGSANSQLRCTGRMNAIPVAGPSQPPSLTNNSISDTRPQNPQRNSSNLTPQLDGNNTPISGGALSQLSSDSMSNPSATQSAFEPDNLYKAGRILSNLNFGLFGWLLHKFNSIQGLLRRSKGGRSAQSGESGTAQCHCNNGC